MLVFVLDKHGRTYCFPTQDVIYSSGRRRCCPCRQPETFSGIGHEVAHEGCNPCCVGWPAHQEMAVSSVKRAAGSDPRPEAVQPPFQGLGGLGEECAGNTRGSSVCLKAINPYSRISLILIDYFASKYLPKRNQKYL
jgi:hypothetical protein